MIRSDIEAYLLLLQSSAAAIEYFPPPIAAEPVIAAMEPQTAAGYASYETEVAEEWTAFPDPVEKETTTTTPATEEEKPSKIYRTATGTRLG